MMRSLWSRAGSSAGDVRVRARACLAGMLAGLERRTSWPLAEHAGERTPDGMQRLFTAARWDQDLVRDDLRGYVTAALGHPDGVLTGHDTGFEKGGSFSAGVQRQYTGTAGKITNCQIGVFLAYASGKGRALIDRELYLPRSWTGDEARLAAAKVPDGTVFRTKPQLLRLMIERAITAGRGRAICDWVDRTATGAIALAELRRIGSRDGAALGSTGHARTGRAALGPPRCGAPGRSIASLISASNAQAIARQPAGQEPDGARAQPLAVEVLFDLLLPGKGHCH